ncbi:hypothetical protein QJS10_CPB04g01905 [Acorus calamus]|uniref:Uncharacterized protein n=1 Tax=Acorus calamus TaxID=4465 RepID=A0AAV9F0F0_ACOCL|nr:hypothetical protein QJS10_CPB04g01905 [Acorus calamus]
MGLPDVMLSADSSLADATHPSGVTTWKRMQGPMDNNNASFKEILDQTMIRT